MDIQIKKPTPEELEQIGVTSWPIWEKEVSRFDWSYESIEECYLLEGNVVVETYDGRKFEFGKGDFVTFAEGLSCIWDIKEPVRKYFNLK